MPALGLVAGNYSGTGGKLDIVVAKKPFLLPCAVIEAYVRRRFGGG
jgi:hypothetical protein